MNTTYGVFISYYLEHQYFNGGTQLRYAFVGGLSVAFGLLSAPLANYLSKHFGFKVPMLTGLLTTVTGQCLAGISRQFGAFLVFQGLVFGSGRRPSSACVLCLCCSHHIYVGLGLASNQDFASPCHELRLTISAYLSHVDANSLAATSGTLV
jgi:hypothetical protein